MAASPEDPIAAGLLDHLLSADDDDDFDDLDSSSDNAGLGLPGWLLDAAEVAAEITGTPHIKFDIARSSVLGFDAALATVVLADAGYQAELRRHWAVGVPEVIHTAAQRSDDLGRLHTELIRRCTGDESIEHIAAPERLLPSNVIIGPWSVSPRLPTARAAASRTSAIPVFQDTHDEWGLEYVQSATTDGLALVDVRVNPDSAESGHVVRVDAGAEVRMLVLRKYRGALAGHAEVAGSRAWAPNEVTIYPPIAPHLIPAAWYPLIASVIAQSTTDELNLWRRMRTVLGHEHPLAQVITRKMR